MHRVFTLALLLGLALCLHSPVAAAEATRQPRSAQPASAPHMTILSPKNGATIADTTVIVELELQNFEPVISKVPLAEFGRHTEANHPNQGHIHLLLDLGPAVTIDQASSYTFTDVTPGHHTLKVALANNDHSALVPPVEQQIEFTTTATTVGSRAAAAPITHRMPRTAEPNDLLTSEYVIMLTILVAMAILIVGLTTQSYSRVALFNAEVNAHMHSIQRIAAARRRANITKSIEIDDEAGRSDSIH